MFDVNFDGPIRLAGIKVTATAGHIRSEVKQSLGLITLCSLKTVELSGGSTFPGRR